MEMKVGSILHAEARLVNCYDLLIYELFKLFSQANLTCVAGWVYPQPRLRLIRTTEWGTL